MLEWLTRFLGLRQTVNKVPASIPGPQAEFDGIPTLPCDLTMLRSDKELELKSIFNCREIEDAWSQIAPSIHVYDIPDGTGGVNPGDRRAIFYLVSHFKPRLVLEIGTHIGASTLHIAAALNLCNSADNGNRGMISVDVTDVNDVATKPWLQHGTKYSPAEMISELGWSGLVQFENRASLVYMAETDQKYDFIFLDGDHGATTVYQEIPAALGLLSKDGVILLHDYFPDSKPLWSNGVVIQGPVQAMDRFRSEGALLRVFPLGQLPWPTKLESNVTSLALVTKEETLRRLG